MSDQAADIVLLPGLGRGSLTSADSDLYQSTNDRPADFHKTAAHQPSVCHFYDPHAKIHCRRYTNTHEWLHALLLTLPRFICQHDSWTLAEVEFCQAESLAWLVGARTSWETF